MTFFTHPQYVCNISRDSEFILVNLEFCVFAKQEVDNINFFYSPTDAQVNCIKTILKFTLKLTLKQLRHVSVQSHHHQGAY